MQVTYEQRDAAKAVNLYQFLLKNHPNDFTIEQRCLRPEADHSVSIKPGANFYHDFAQDVDGKNNGTHDNIDFMMKYYNLSYQDAVLALINGEDKSVPAYRDDRPRKFRLPDENVMGYNNLIKYLYEDRAISIEVIWELMEAKLIYEDIRKNVVFVSKARDWWESVSADKKTKGEKLCATGAKPGKFWWFSSGEYDTVYICEGAIDAVSLYEYRERQPGVYISMHGIGNHSIIDRIVGAGKYHVILAVDNDKAGDACRQKYPNLEHMVPEGAKDWNEMLQKRKVGMNMNNT